MTRTNEYKLLTLQLIWKRHLYYYSLYLFSCNLLARSGFLCLLKSTKIILRKIFVRIVLDRQCTATENASWWKSWNKLIRKNKNNYHNHSKINQRFYISIIWQISAFADKFILPTKNNPFLIINFNILHLITPTFFVRQNSVWFNGFLRASPKEKYHLPLAMWLIWYALQLPNDCVLYLIK